MTLNWDIISQNIFKSKNEYEIFVKPKVLKTFSEIEGELDALQLAYINSDDEVEQLEIVRKFMDRLRAATQIDQIDRIGEGITIHNWTRAL